MMNDRKDPNAVSRANGTHLENPGSAGPVQRLADRLGPVGARRYMQRRSAQQRAARAEVEGQADGAATSNEQPMDDAASSSTGRTGTAGVPTGAGAPLEPGVREHMERAFGANFSQVRVHEDSHAEQLGARAYAQGSDLHFAPGTYDPATAAGRELIGHELTHVAQQHARRVAAPQGKDAPINTDAGLEAEADDLGGRAARGEIVQLPGGSPAKPERTGAGAIQGVFLDRVDTPEDKFAAPVPKATSEVTTSLKKVSGGILHPKRADWKTQLRQAVEEYELADNNLGRPAEARTALEALRTLAARVRDETTHAVLKGIAAQLAQEAQQLIDDWNHADGAAAGLAAKRNPDQIIAVRNEAYGRLIKYRPSSRNKFGNHVTAALNRVYLDCNKIVRDWAAEKADEHGQDPAETAEYGDATTGQIDAETRGLLDEFKRIQHFVESKDDVVKELRPIADEVRKVDDKQKLTKLKEQLANVEKLGGFPDVVLTPMGILPGDVFLRFNAMAVMDDYGAGVVHGELSHRMQWAAITQHVLKGGFKHTAWELYSKMSSAPFAGGRRDIGASMFGTVVDSSTQQHAKTYRAPATLNRDLLEAVPKNHPAHHSKSEKFPLPERPKDYEPPEELDSVAPIGIALSLLREERVRQELEAVKTLTENSMDVQVGRRQWSGAPSEETATKTAARMTGEDGGYQIKEEGVVSEHSAFDPIGSAAPQKAWKILEPKPTSDTRGDGDDTERTEARKG